MFELERFSGSPGGALAAELEAVDPFALDEDEPAAYPHGPTCPCNLGPLCTRHHRAKTHGGWQLVQPRPGSFWWRSPSGRHYLVDHTGTTTLDPLDLPAAADGDVA